MKEQDFINAIKEIHADPALEDKIIKKCRAAKAVKRPSRLRRPLLTAAACLVAIALVVTGIPIIQHNIHTGETEIAWVDTLSFKVSARGREALTLEENMDMMVPSSNSLLFSTKLINGEKVEILDAMMAADFIISGQNIKSVTYTAENGMMFSEFNSYDHDTDGDDIWSSASALASLAEYSSWCGNVDAPTKEELVRILNDLHSRQELTAFYNEIYTPFLVELEKANYSWEKEYELIQEKYREPIDFNQFTLQGEVVEDQLVIKIVNPAHPPVNPVEAKSITAGGEDTVSWYIDFTSEYGKQFFGQKKEDLDLTQISDEIKVLVESTSGETVSGTIHVNFTAEGKFKVRLSI